MIPKNLISVWMGRGEKCDLYKRCREAKERVFEGWNFIDITEDNCAIMDSPFMRAAEKDPNKKVHMTSAARRWALKEFSGCYLDEDVMPLKDFTPLLNTGFFIGRESGEYYCDAVIGAAPGSEVMSRLFWQFPLGCEAGESAIAYGPPNASAIINALPDRLRGELTIHDQEVFYPYLFGQEPLTVFGERTYAHHLWTYSWRPK